MTVEQLVEQRAAHLSPVERRLLVRIIENDLKEVRTCE